MIPSVAQENAILAWARAVLDGVVEPSHVMWAGQESEVQAYPYVLIDGLAGESLSQGETRRSSQKVIVDIVPTTIGTGDWTLQIPRDDGTTATVTAAAPSSLTDVLDQWQTEIALESGLSYVDARPDSATLRLTGVAEGWPGPLVVGAPAGGVVDVSEVQKEIREEFVDLAEATYVFTAAHMQPETGKGRAFDAAQVISPLSSAALNPALTRSLSLACIPPIRRAPVGRTRRQAAGARWESRAAVSVTFGLSPVTLTSVESIASVCVSGDSGNGPTTTTIDKDD